MHYIHEYLQFILHINTHLAPLMQTYGGWFYAVIFTIIFLESGLVLTPFLPGESMLFALGAVTAAGSVAPHLMVFLLAIAAILGGFVNYALGYFVGKRIFLSLKASFIIKTMARTEEFYKKHGVMAVLLARVVPILRTFVPFFAGVVRMPFPVFALFNSIGGVVWICFFIYIGYFFGSIPVIKQHFSWFVIGIIIFSVVPIAYEFIKSVRRKRNETNL